jgi:hypothetical protein
MRPALFLLLSLSIGALLLPLTPEETAHLSASRMGRVISESWMALVLYRMCVFAAFPIGGALICELFTPGEVTRGTLRKPFSQQCYIFAPFALVVSPSLVLLGRGALAGLAGVLLANVWAFLVELIYYRRQPGFDWINATAAAVIVLLVGWISMIGTAIVLF